MGESDAGALGTEMEEREFLDRVMAEKIHQHCEKTNQNKRAFLAKIFKLDGIGKETAGAKTPLAAMKIYASYAQQLINEEDRVFYAPIMIEGTGKINAAN
jgi:hypothetical protein